MLFRKKKEKEGNQLTDTLPVIDDDDLYDVEKPEKYKVITMEESTKLREEAGLIKGKNKVPIKKLKKMKEKRRKKIENA